LLLQADYKTIPDISRKAIQELFNYSIPNQAILWSALSGSIPSSIYLDDVLEPTKVLVRADFLGWTFLGGNWDRTRLASETSSARNEFALSVVGDFDKIESCSDLSSFGFSPRLFFDEVDFELLEEVPLKQHSTDTIRIANLEQFDSCFWKELMISGYGSSTSFIDGARLFQLLVDGVVVCETYLTFVSNGLCELGAVSAEGARGLGYGFSLVRHVILWAK
jgi:hypothetical protein